MVQYELEAQIRLCDEAEFNVAQMSDGGILDEQKAASLLDSFNTSRVAPPLRKKEIFLAPNTIQLQQDDITPQIAIRPFKESEGDDDERKINPEAVDGLAEELNELPWEMNGCRVKAVRLEFGLWDRDLIVANGTSCQTNLVSMEPDEKKHVQWYLYEVFARLAKVHEKILATQISETQESEFLKVSVVGMESLARLRWNMRGKNGRLLIYRNAQGFTEDIEAIRGQDHLIVDASSDGDAPMELDRGKTYYFTCLLTEKAKAPSQGLGRSVAAFFGRNTAPHKDTLMDLLRFSVRVLNEHDLASLHTLLGGLLQNEASADPLKQKYRTALKELDCQIEFNEELDKVTTRLVEKIQVQHLSSDVKVEKMKRINEVIEEMRVRYLQAS